MLSAPLIFVVMRAITQQLNGRRGGRSRCWAKGLSFRGSGVSVTPNLNKPCLADRNVGAPYRAATGRSSPKSNVQCPKSFGWPAVLGLFAGVGLRLDILAESAPSERRGKIQVSEPFEANAGFASQGFRQRRCSRRACAFRGRDVGWLRWRLRRQRFLRGGSIGIFCRRGEQ